MFMFIDCYGHESQLDDDDGQCDFNGSVTMRHYERSSPGGQPEMTVAKGAGGRCLAQVWVVHYHPIPSHTTPYHPRALSVSVALSGVLLWLFA